MQDKKTVMEWLEICGKNRECKGRNCPYGLANVNVCEELLMEDALKLLKEQEQIINGLEDVISVLKESAI